MEVAGLAGRPRSVQDPQIMIFYEEVAVDEGQTKVDFCQLTRAATTTPQNSCSPPCHSTTSASLSACGALESSPYAFIPISYYDHSWADGHLM